MRNIVTVARVEPSMTRRRQKDRVLSHTSGENKTQPRPVWQRCVVVLVVSSVCRVRGSLA
jgi:hypothetical protein